MDTYEKDLCRKFTVQVYNWLKSRYDDKLYDFIVLEDENFVNMKIRMNVEKQFYEKRGIGILNYIIRANRIPDLIRVNWRYNRSMFEINVLCSDKK
jgi:hypothetical protein